MAKGTEHCRRCGTELVPGQARCTACGVSVIPKKRGATENNRILEKDRWSFSEAAPSDQTASKAGVQFDKTMAMNAIESRLDERPNTASKGSRPAPEPLQTRALEPSKAGAKAVVEPRGKTLLGQAKLSPKPLTIPLDLKTEGPPKRDVSTAEKQSSPHVTAPIPLVETSGPQSNRNVIPHREEDPVGAKAAPDSGQVVVKSGSRRKGPTAPVEFPTPMRLNPVSAPGIRDKARMGSLRLRRRGIGAHDATRTNVFFMGFAATILIATWFVPNVLAPPLVFPVQLLGTYSGIQLIAQVTTPLVGAIVLTLLVAPLPLKFRAMATLLLGLIAIAVPLLLLTPAVPLSGHLVLLVVLAATGASLVIQLQTANSLLWHIALALLPAAFIAVALVGFVTARLPVANVVVLKDPLMLYAGMLLVAVSAEDLISKRSN